MLLGRQIQVYNFKRHKFPLRYLSREQGHCSGGLLVLCSFLKHSNALLWRGLGERHLQNIWEDDVIVL